MSASYIETFQVYLIVVEFAFYVMQAVPQRKIRSYEVRPAQSKRAFRIPFPEYLHYGRVHGEAEVLLHEIFFCQPFRHFDITRSAHFHKMAEKRIPWYVRIPFCQRIHKCLCLLSPLDRVHGGCGLDVKSADSEPVDRSSQENAPCAACECKYRNIRIVFFRRDGEAVV